MSVWMIYALLTLAFWGLTGLTQKLSTKYISVELSFAWFAAAFVPIAGVILWMAPLDWNVPVKAYSLAVTGGVLNGLGVLTSFAAFRKGGKASVVTPLIALYPVVTVALAVPLLHERVSRREWAAIALALAAAVALSYEGKSKSDRQSESSHPGGG